MGVPQLSALTPLKRLIADRAYDAARQHRWLKAQRSRALIPSTATRGLPYPLDRAAYRRRNPVERLFCRLKNWRRIATQDPDSQGRP